MRYRLGIPRLWTLHGLTLKDLLVRVWREIMDDDVMGQSAKLAFYLLLALFPLLIVFTSVFGYFAQSVELRDSLLDYFRRVVPPSAFQLVKNTLNQVTEGAGGGKLSLGILGSIFAASSGIAAIIDGLNTAYEVEEQRPWWKVRLRAIGLTIGFSLFTVSGLLLILLGPRIGNLLARYVGHGGLLDWLWNAGRWPIAFFIVLLAFNLLYRYAPDLKQWALPFFTPGALVAVGLWIAVSLGFRVYLHYFNTYNATYGSLGAAVILMLWLYLTGAALLVGAEVNSELENAAAEHGEANARLPGEKSPGEKSSGAGQRARGRIPNPFRHARSQ